MLLSDKSTVSTGRFAGVPLTTKQNRNIPELFIETQNIQRKIEQEKIIITTKSM